MLRRLLITTAVLAASLAVYVGSALAGQPTTAIAWHVACKFSHSRQVDPIVSPGVEPSAHLHDFFGNEGVTSTTTPDQLAANPTTCGLTIDKTGYWIPTTYDSTTGKHLIPVRMDTYYLGEKGVKHTPIPAGLEMVAGNSHATQASEAQHIQFDCGFNTPKTPYPRDCAVGSMGPIAEVFFPFCWNQTGLKPTDVVYGDSTGACPAGTVEIPQVTERFHYAQNKTTSSDFLKGTHLTYSSGPWYTLHADFMNGWDVTEMQKLTTKCLDGGINCNLVDDAHPLGS